MYSAIQRVATFCTWEFLFRFLSLFTFFDYIFLRRYKKFLLSLQKLVVAFCRNWLQGISYTHFSAE